MPPRSRQSARSLPAWARFESHVQQLLGLKSTIGSGNQFHDPGDGRTAEHYTENPYPLMVDAKCTGLKSYTITKKDLQQWVKRAALFGCRFGLPIRFQSEGETEDYIVVGLDDFAEFYGRCVNSEKNQEARSQALKYLWWVCNSLKDESVRVKMSEHLQSLENE